GRAAVSGKHAVLAAHGVEADDDRVQLAKEPQAPAEVPQADLSLLALVPVLADDQVRDRDVHLLRQAAAVGEVQGGSAFLGAAPVARRTATPWGGRPFRSGFARLVVLYSH